MSNKEILTKAFKKAEQNGWRYFGAGVKYLGNPPKWKVTGPEHAPVIALTTGNPSPGRSTDLIYYEALIFRHDFAKAFWGEDGQGWHLEEIGGSYQSLPNWQYHLQQLVLEEDPLQYIAKFL